MKILVYHRMYGCDTGCCGHAISVDGVEDDDSFAFAHPDTGESHKEFARRFAEDYLKKHNPKCLETIDWGTLEVDVSDD